MKRGLILLCCILGIACRKKDSPPTTPPVAPATPPAAAVLLFPLQNEECTTGTFVSTTQSGIPFSWNRAENAESYELHIKNLETGISTLQMTSQTNLDITLSRNTPYSWYVVSKTSKSSAITNSAVWKFYNSGPGKTTYAPFPADLVSPAIGQAIAKEGKITLDWTGSDVDDDIVNYDVYLGSRSQSPELLKENISASVLDEVNVISNTTYYWKVITRDSLGNTSDSGVSHFHVK